MTWFLFLLALSSAPSTDFIAQVTDEYERGQITAQELVILRDKATRAPHTLSPQYQKMLSDYPLSGRSLTALLVDTFQLARRKGVKLDYSFPLEMAYYRDSDTYPLRVYYNLESQAAQAQTLLSYAEDAWQREIIEWGFYAPPIVAPEGRYRVYLGDARGAAGFTAPIGTFDETEWDDCVTYIVIEQQMREWMMYDTMAHELNHATQAAMDCMEPTAFWENTAVFVETALSSHSINMAAYYSEAFQLEAYKGLSAGFTGDLYWYGGFMWPLFLADHLGDGANDAIFIRQIWERSMQSSGFMTNAPTYLDAIDEVAQEKGSTLHQVFEAFSRARYFVDNLASSSFSTMPYASNLYPVPPQVGTITLGTTLQTFSPPEEKRPQRYGVNYINLKNPGDFSFGVIVTIIPQGDDPWRAQVFSVDNPHVEPAFSVVQGDSLRVAYDAEAFGDSVLVVEHLAESGFNPAGLPVGESYTVQVEPAIAFPVITLLSPSAVTGGSSHEVVVYGANFQEGSRFTFTPQSGITVTQMRVESSSKVILSLDVSSDAILGPYSLSIVNDDGGEHTLESALTIMEGSASNSTSTSGDGLFSCAASRGATQLPFGFVLLLLGAVLFRKRVA